MPPLETLAKHLSGKHDQKTHGGGGAAGSSSASSPSSPEPVGSLDGVPFTSDYLNDINYEMYEPNPPAVLYHVAPKSARDDIATNGLDPADRTWNTGASMGGEYRDEHLWTTGDDGEEFAYEYRPEGIYMFSDLGRAKQYAAGNKGDIYQIDTEVNSREIIRDPSQATNWEYEDPTEHAYVTRYVEPAALTRLDVGKSVGEPIFKHGDHSDPDHDLGIGRRDMPQIDVAQFTRMLQRRGIESTRRTVDPATLRRSQDGLNPKKVRDIATSGEPIDRIIVSRDDHILDGHHRWAAATERGEDIEALVVDMGIEELLALVERSDVEKATVIRFAPGLVPRLNTTTGIMKHLPGQHDQAQHGRKGSGGDTRAALEARAAALDAEGRGASAAVYRLRLHTDGPGGVRAFTRRESDSASLPVRDGQRQQVATKAVHELTPDAKAILRAGGISTPVVHELDAENGGAEFFHAAISRSKEGNPYASSVFVYEPSEYRGMRLFVSDDGQSGIALKGDEIVSLFKTGTSGDREVSRPLLELGIQEGGRRGDCFDTVLPKIYAEHGLEVRHRVAWNDEYAPEGWDKRLYKKWNNGEPDVTFFRYNRDYTDGYRPGQGTLVDSYDDAVSLTQAEVLKQGPPVTVMEKHGDPSRPGYAQLHPTGPTGRYDHWGDHASRIAEAERRGPDSEALSFMAAGETYYDTEEEALEAFKEVYNYRHEGTNNNGEKVVLTAEVTGVMTNPGEGTFVEGRIKNEQGQQVGWFERKFSTDSDGAPVVEHVLLELRPGAQGTGFATEFNARAEDYYVSHGVDAITLHAALGNGGYTWAKAGYAFDTRPSMLRQTRDLLGPRLDNPEEYVTSGGPRDLQQLRDLGSRLRKSPTDPDFPTPLEISRVGYIEGASTWAGKELLVGSEWFGEKLLRAEGPTAKAVAAQVSKHGDPSRPGYAQLHPTGAGSAYAEWGDHAGRIAAAEERGPSKDVLRTAIDGGSLVMPPEDEIAEWIEQNRPDDIDMTIDNNYGLYQRKEEIEGTEYEQDWERDEAIQDLRRDAAYLLASEDQHMYSEAMGRGPYYDDGEAQAAFGEVYDYMHSGVNKEGDLVNLSAEVMSVETWQGNVKVSGMITDDNGNPVGNFERRFFKDDNGRLMVEHELLELDDSVQGAGFATEFNARAEDYYISHGVQAIRVHAALDQGGYTWASAGFDFDPRPWSLKESKANITGRIDDYLSDTSPGRAPLSPAQRERLTSIRDRLESKDHTDPDFPTPFEIASFGRTSGAETWPGSEIMTGSNWYGEKPLTPAGRRRSATEAANKSAFIRIAPGLVPTLKHLRGRHDQRTHFPGAGRSGAELRQEAEERNIDYLLRGDTWVDEQLSRGRVLLPPPPGVIERVAEARNRVKQWVEERRNPPVDSLSHDEVLELVRINRATVDAQRAARGLPPKDWPPYPDPVSKAAGDVLAILGRVFAGVVDDRLIRLMALMGPLEDVGEPWSGLLTDMIEGALTGLPDDVFKHLAGKHDQKTHGSGGGGYAAGNEEFQRDQESWFNKMLAERQASDSPLLTEGQMRLPQDERLKAAVAARLAERMSDIPADRMAEAAFVGSRLDYVHPELITAREAMQPGSWVTIRDPSVQSMTFGAVGELMVLKGAPQDPGGSWVRSGTPEAAAKVRQVAASRMVKMWAASSNDENIVSLAVQDAAAAEFGMKDHAPWPAQGDVGKFARQRVDAITASHGDVYRSYVRAQYDETQAMFKDMGIGSVRVHRGVLVEESIMRDAFDISGTQLTGGARLRPLSSWSSDPKEAQSFAMDTITGSAAHFRIVMETRLPVSQILSTPYTGVGCRNEKEVVSVTPTVEADIQIIQRVG